MNRPYDWSQNYRHPTDWDQPFEPLSLPKMLADSVAETRGGEQRG